MIDGFAKAHTPQRHEGDVTDQQLQDRALHGIDPMTGTTEDGVRIGRRHRYGQHATRVTSEPAYVQGDDHLRRSPQFEAARGNAVENGLENFPLRCLWKRSMDQTTSSICRVSHARVRGSILLEHRPAFTTNVYRLLGWNYESMV